MSSWRRLAVHVWGPPSDPTVYGNLEIPMRQALVWLDEANREAPVKITPTHLVVKAIAKALAEHPAANALIARGRIWERENVDVYCQVATDGGRDLSGVKVCRADHKSVVDVASEQTKQVLGRIPQALLGRMLRLTAWLTYDRLLDLSALGIAFDQFGGAMVSNVGTFGVGHGLAPLVPISRVPIVLLVCGVEDRPAVEHGQVVVAPYMTVGATFDHRLIDGFQASRMSHIVIDSVSDPFKAFGAPSRSTNADAPPPPRHDGTSGSDGAGNGYSHRPAPPRSGRGESADVR